MASTTLELALMVGDIHSVHLLEQLCSVAKPRGGLGELKTSPLSSRATHKICTEPMKNISGTIWVLSSELCQSHCARDPAGGSAPDARCDHCKTSGLATDFIEITVWQFFVFLCLV